MMHQPMIAGSFGRVATGRPEMKRVLIILIDRDDRKFTSRSENRKSYGEEEEAREQMNAEEKVP